MKAREFVTPLINESISIEAAIKNIVSTGESISKVYRDLKEMAERWVYNNSTLKGFHRNAVGVGKRWYDAFFWNKMERDLHTLIEKNPRGAARIKDFFNIDRDEKGHISFTSISKSLPQVLYQVGQQMNNDALKNFGRRWAYLQQDYELFLSKVEQADEEPQQVARQPKDTTISRQNAAAEDIVNQVLKSLDKKVAGDIRNAIAREANKLQALQRELAKRNIKISEELDEDLRQVLQFATQAHAGQTRSSGEPYISHPISVAQTVEKHKKSKNLDALIAAAYLHDTIEDTDTTHEDLEKMFGGLVASLVQELTSDKEQISRVGKTEYLSKKMAHDMSSYALVIKLADRLDNVQDITTAKTPAWRAKYREETERILDYIEKNRVLSGTHKRLVGLIRNKLKEIPVESDSLA